MSFQIDEQPGIFSVVPEFSRGSELRCGMDLKLLDSVRAAVERVASRTNIDGCQTLDNLATTFFRLQSSADLKLSYLAYSLHSTIFRYVRQRQYDGLPLVIQQLGGPLLAAPGLKISALSPGSHLPADQLLIDTLALEHDSSYSFDLDLSSPSTRELSDTEEVISSVLKKIGSGSVCIPLSPPSCPNLIRASTGRPQLLVEHAEPRWRRSGARGWGEPDRVDARIKSGHDDGGREKAKLTHYQKISCVDPGTQEELQSLVSNFTLIREPHLSAGSSFPVYGLIYLHVLRNGEHWVRFLEHMAHETAHHWLFAVWTLDPILLADGGQRYQSPLRNDLRPLSAIFHQFFVLARVVRIWSLFQRSAYSCPEMQITHTHYQNDRDGRTFTEKFLTASRVLEQNARFTSVGQAIFDECRAMVESNPVYYET